MSEIKLINKFLDVNLQNSIGNFLIGSYEFINNNQKEEVVIVYKRGTFDKSIVNLRVNSACFTSDIFGCNRCDCHEQLVEALKYFNEKDNGILIYLMNHEGRGIGITNKLKTYFIMDEQKFTTAEAFKYLHFNSDPRDYSCVIEILKDLNIKKVYLLTNNPDKMKYLSENNIEVTGHHKLISQNSKLHNYLISKQKDFGHLIEEDDFHYE